MLACKLVLLAFAVRFVGAWAKVDSSSRERETKHRVRKHQIHNAADAQPNDFSSNNKPSPVMRPSPKKPIPIKKPIHQPSPIKKPNQKPSPIKKPNQKPSPIKKPSVSTSTLYKKIIFGYQGWFSTNKVYNLGWRHWSNSKLSPPNSSSVTFDLFPDVTEYPTSALSNNTILTSRVTGRPMDLYDSLGVVDVHFSWMKEYSIHGVAIQRFVNEIANPVLRQRRDSILQACMVAAEKYSRSFFVEYDTSGADTNLWSQIIISDWIYLTTKLNITSSYAYQKEKGKPVLKIFGIGFTSRPGNSTESLALINHLKQEAFFVGSVPTFWRDGTGDSKSNFSSVYGAMDIVSPWLVGRFSSTTQFDKLFYDVFLKDLALTSSRQQGYAPSVFPGFSWSNLQRNNGKQSPLNSIPRDGGRFWVHQVDMFMTKLIDKATGYGAHYIFGAMFDEFDESTAMIKAASTEDNLPVEGTFLHLSIDGEKIPSDYYLSLAGKYSSLYSNLDSRYSIVLLSKTLNHTFMLSESELHQYQKRAKVLELSRVHNLLGKGSNQVQGTSRITK